MATTPRISQTPDSVIDLVDRQLTRATTGETHPYYMNLVKLLRSTLVLVLLVAGVAFAVFAAGIAAAVYVAGLPFHMAVGLGVLGGSASTVLGSVTLGRYALKAVSRFKSLAASNEKGSPPPDEAAPPAPDTTSAA
ncbi:hypothetical protein [Nocardia bovistercoris]|uniref:Uncharacterized protein n=1 Tax=Nocardia bovistercoris TaxID=2785916 RepID=A0A931IGY7_9NOCA|nr:hypothetical protein [Nocardia bovistercoris]MBH0780388.1 hypothetical protein [Nocardia bovistercoris]